MNYEELGDHLHAERHAPLREAVGWLVLEAGRLEGFLAAFSLVSSSESITPAGLERVAKLRTGKIVDDLLKRRELPLGASEALKPLLGDGGLLKRRDRIVHAIWSFGSDGVVTGANLRQSLFRAEPRDPEPAPITLDDVREVARGLELVADKLAAWVFLTMGTKRPPE